MLVTPAQVLALSQLIDAPDGLPRDDPGLAVLQPDLPALGPLLTVTEDRLAITSAELRAALRAALTPYRPATDPVARLRAFLSDGKTRAALACLDDLGGVFCSMIHGLDVAERIAALFPDQLREDEPWLVMLDAVNAMKSGQLARADYLVTRLQGRRRLPALDQDQSRQDYRLVTFRFVKAIYEDQPIGAQALQQLYRTLGRVPVTSPVERGLLNHVALDVYLRKGDWDAVGQAYEAGVPQAWVDHMMTQEASISFGDLWPAMAEPILTYGRRARGAYRLGLRSGRTVRDPELGSLIR